MRKVHLAYMSQSQLIIEESQRRNQAGAEAGTMEESQSLADLSPLTCSADFHVQPRPACPRVAMPTVAWDLSHK